jgi:hypothetical protein
MRLIPESKGITVPSGRDISELTVADAYSFFQNSENTV